MFANKLKSYRLSNEADIDLNDIFDYTEQEHGFNQAVRYLSDLENLFERLVKNPNLGRERKEIHRNIFSIQEQQHTVFYQIQKDQILVIRVLHCRKDVPNLIK